MSETYRESRSRQASIIDYEATTPDAGYRELAAAIVLRAAEDYKNALRMERRLRPNLAYRTPGVREKYNGAVRTIKECERFFASDWCAQLTDINGEAILRGIREQAGV